MTKTLKSSSSLLQPPSLPTSNHPSNNLQHRLLPSAMPSSELYWNVLWWLSGASFQAEQRYERSCTSLASLPGTVIREKGSLSIIIHEIRRTLGISDYFKVMPWSWDVGVVPLDVSFFELMEGSYGEISMEKPLTFVLIGAWTFDMTLERGELVSMIDLYANSDIGILKGGHERLEGVRGHAVIQLSNETPDSRLTQTATPERYTDDVQDYLPSYSLLVERDDIDGSTSESEFLESLVDHVGEPSDIEDGLPPYSELPRETITNGSPEPDGHTYTSTSEVSFTSEPLIPLTTNPFSPPTSPPLPQRQGTIPTVFQARDHLYVGLSIPGAFPQD